MTHSRKFFEKMVSEARPYLPGWLYASIAKAARDCTDGDVHGRPGEPSAIEKLALAELSDAQLHALGDRDLRLIWKGLHKWYLSERSSGSTEVQVVAASKIKKEFTSRELPLIASPLIAVAAEFDSLNGTEQVKSEPVIKSSGPRGAKVAFVESSLDAIERARREHLVGPPGACFAEKYLGPLGLAREDVHLSAMVPQVLVDLDGKMREPRSGEIELWKEAHRAELAAVEPLVTVALGQLAGKTLGDLSDVTLPHPAAVARFRDSGEVARKIKKIKNLINKRSAVIKSLAKKLASGEGEEPSTTWHQDWHKMLPASGDGRFVYQHHWRGLEEDEIGLSDSDLMRSTDHSIHGDLRMEGNSGLWGFTILLGRAVDNCEFKHLDKLIDGQGKLEAVPKGRQPTEWLDVGSEKPLISSPGGTGAASESFAKFFLIDSGNYQLGVVEENEIEFFVDSKYMHGRYLLVFVPVSGGGRWLIYKPKNQTPVAETADLADVLGELRKKNQRYLVWGKPGEKSRLIDVRSGKTSNSEPVKVSKSDPVKRIVYGVVLDPYGGNGAEADGHNDYNPPAEVERTAHGYAKGPRIVRLQHRKAANAQVVETWVEPYPSRKDYLAAMRGDPHRVYRRPFGGDVLHSGAWIMGVELGPTEWKLFENGTLNAFSPGGFGVRTAMSSEDMPIVSFVDLVERNA